MRYKVAMVILVVALMSSVVFPTAPVAAQNLATVSLEEQLRAQYQLARLDPTQKQVLERGSVLAIQKEGVFAVAPNFAACPSKYENGNLYPPSGPCVDTAKSSSRNFLVGEKVYPTGMTIDLKRGTIALAVSSLETFYKALVAFQFSPGYLERASVLEVEDRIGEVLAIYTPPTEAPPTASTEQPAAVGATPGQALTNDDIIKLVQIKLGDSLIITKIKSSACAFDTSTDGLVRLKQAGVSDAVLQAMLEAGGQLMPAPPPQPSEPPAEAALLSAGPEKSVELQNAEMSAKNFVEQGGSFRLPVRHVHAMGDCFGLLTVERGYLSFRTHGGGKKAHDFRVSGAEIIGMEQRDQEPGGFPTHPLFLRFRGPDGKEKRYYLTVSCHSHACLNDQEEVTRIVVRLVQQYVK
jgi:hypothetical protein